MSQDIQPLAPPGWPAFEAQWSKTVASVLRLIAGQEFSAQFASIPDPAPPSQDAAPSHWFLIGLEKQLAGELAIEISQPAAVCLAQLLMSDPVNAEAAFSQDYQDAVAELFRQFCGSFSTALRGLLGGETDVKLTALQLPAWKPSAESHLHLTGDLCPPMAMRLTGSEELLRTLALSKLAQDAAPSSAETDSAVPAASSPPANVNLDLLSTVLLDARLNFGERNMLLSEVLGCAPGTVLESDRATDTPVDLCVEGLLVARGEMVIVDGCYGLRVQEICRLPAQSSRMTRRQVFAA